jgi:hypothetical protein
MARVSQVSPLTMAWCLSCHRDPAPNLRPRSEITTMGWANMHADASSDSTGKRLAHEYGVRRLTNCSTCHR